VAVIVNAALVALGIVLFLMFLLFLFIGAVVIARWVPYLVGLLTSLLVLAKGLDLSLGKGCFWGGVVLGAAIVAGVLALALTVKALQILGLLPRDLNTIWEGYPFEFP
jgi:hypothetical protein